MLIDTYEILEKANDDVKFYQICVYIKSVAGHFGEGVDEGAAGEGNFDLCAASDLVDDVNLPI